MRTEADLNRIAKEIISAAIAVHRVIGPGCFESAYFACLAYEFRKRNIEYRMKVPIAIKYEDLRVPRAYEADFIVREDIVVEVKATSSLGPLDARQLSDVSPLLRLPARSVAELWFVDAQGRDQADRE
jgi:GxxExxY protein